MLLRKRIKYLRDKFFGNPDPVIGNVHLQMHFLLCHFFLHINMDITAFRGKFNGIIDQVDHDLFQSGRISNVDFHFFSTPFKLVIHHSRYCLRLCDHIDIIPEFSGIKSLVHQYDISALDTRHIQNIV